MNNNSNYIIYQKHIHISMFLILLEIMEDFYIDFYFLCIYIYISFNHIVQFYSLLQIYSLLSSSSKFSSILFIAGVDYLKVKNDINH